MEFKCIILSLMINHTKVAHYGQRVTFSLFYAVFFFLCCFLAVLLSLQLCFASYYLFTVLGFVSWRLHSLCYSALACGMFWLQSMFLFFVLHRHHLVLQLKFSLNKSSLNKSLLCR